MASKHIQVSSTTSLRQSKARQGPAVKVHPVTLKSVRPKLMFTDAREGTRVGAGAAAATDGADASLAVLLLKPVMLLLLVVLMLLAVLLASLSLLPGPAAAAAAAPGSLEAMETMR